MDRYRLSAALLAVALLVPAGCGGKTEPPAPARPAAPAIKDDVPDAPPPSPAASRVPPETKAPAAEPAKPAVAVWTLDAKEMRVPDVPVAGRLGGQPFALDKAEVSNTGTLSLRQGKDFVGDREVKVFLFLDKNRTPAGMTFEVTPATGPGGPHVFASWKDGDKMPTATFGEKYALRLEFGPEADGRLPGKIYLGLPDDAKSFLAGTFVADLEPDYTKPPRPSEAPYVAGKVALKGRDKYDLAAGFVGLSDDGKPVVNLAGTIVTPGQDASVASTTFAPQITLLANDAAAGCVYRHVRLAPGRYLVYVRLGERFADWHWVEVKDNAQTSLDFTVEPDSAGGLEVVLPAKGSAEKARLVPLAPDGSAPDLKDALGLLTDTVLKTDLPAKDGKVVLDGLRPGKYRVLAGAARRDVTVKAKETVKVNFSAE